MNKKILIISVLVTLIAIAGGVLFLSRPLSVSLEQVFPSNALGFVRLSHVASDLESFSQNDFWKSVSTIDLPKVLEHNKASARDIEQIKVMQNQLDLLLKNPLTKKFLGQEMAVGFYEKISSEGKDNESYYDALFAIRLGFTFQIAEFFVSMAHQLSDDVTTTEEKYQDFKIIHVRFPKRHLEIQYIRIQNVLFASLAPSNILHQMLDVYHKKTSSLAEDSNFSKSNALTYASGHGIFYINFERFYGFIKNHAPKEQKEYLNEISKDISGFKSSTLSFLPGQISKLKFIMHYEPQELNAYWRAIFSCAPQGNLSLKFVPHNVMAYHWGNCYDFNNVLDQAKDASLSSKKEEYGNFLNKIEKKLKLSIHDEVLAAFDSQMGWYLDDIDTQGAFPYPRMVLFFKLKDRSAIERVIEKFSRKAIVPFQHEEYSQTPIHYMSIPLGEDIDLGYTFLGDFLLLGSSKQLLKTSIDALNNQDQSIQSTDFFKQFNSDNSNLNQAVVLIKTDEVSKRLQQLLNWYNKVVSSQITAALTYQREAKQQQKELEEEAISKKEDLNLASKKLKELKQVILPVEASSEEIADQTSKIEHLNSDVQQLKEEILSNQKEQQKIKDSFVSYQSQSEGAKLWLFNSDEVFVPLLKGLEGIHAISMQIHMKDRITETEILVK